MNDALGMYLVITAEHEALLAGGINLLRRPGAPSTADTAA